MLAIQKYKGKNLVSIFNIFSCSTLRSQLVIEGNHFFGFGRNRTLTPIGFAKPKLKPKPTNRNHRKLFFQTFPPQKLPKTFLFLRENRENLQIVGFEY